MKIIMDDNESLIDTIKNYNINVNDLSKKYKMRSNISLGFQFITFVLGSICLNSNYFAALGGGLIGATVSKYYINKNAEILSEQSLYKKNQATKKIKKLTLALQKVNENIEMQNFEFDNLKVLELNADFNLADASIEISNCIGIYDNENKLRVLEQIQKFKGKNLKLSQINLYDNKNEYFEEAKKNPIKLKMLEKK